MREGVKPGWLGDDTARHAWANRDIFLGWRAGDEATLSGAGVEVTFDWDGAEVSSDIIRGWEKDCVVLCGAREDPRPR